MHKQRADSKITTLRCRDPRAAATDRPAVTMLLQPLPHLLLGKQDVLSHPRIVLHELQLIGQCAWVLPLHIEKARSSCAHELDKDTDTLLPSGHVMHWRSEQVIRIPCIQSERKGSAQLWSSPTLALHGQPTSACFGACFVFTFADDAGYLQVNTRNGAGFIVLSEARPQASFDSCSIFSTQCRALQELISACT